MSETSAPLTVIAQIAKVQTLADGGVRWTFDGPEDAVMQSAALMEMKRLGFPVELRIKAYSDDDRNELDELLGD